MPTSSFVQTPALMLQGCSSNAGKSVLTAAFCRMLLRDGYRVAPFKAQNMSLNSFVTLRGEELGRAQATQAMACRMEPDARMNPVLLKPSAPSGSQVIVMGKPVGHMQVADYIKYKPTAFAAVQRAYDELAAEHDVIVIEGAGSPAEINLKTHDIVNMAMAHYARAKVLLVGDIDRGGVFAHFVGTMMLLPPEDRALVAGLLINRFRGDASLLDPAFPEMRRHTGVDVLGVVPYLKDLGLPEEDSVSFKEALPGAQGAKRPDSVTIACVDLPHISNFTDLDALALEPDVQLRVIRSVDDLQALETVDALLLPGTKSTASDLQWLRETGLAACIADLAKTAAVMGICGGLQMLGATIADPEGVESGHTTIPGLGLLPLHTEMGEEKQLWRSAGTHTTSGLPVHGYEIHHGLTTATASLACIQNAEGHALGWGSDGVWGTYLHGVFDADAFRRWFVNGLRERKGLPPLDGVQSAFAIDPALDRLADVVREAVDWERIKAAMGL